MTLDLSKSRVGDRYEARDGEVWTFSHFSKWWDDTPVYACRNTKNQLSAFSIHGMMACVDNYWLVRALDAPAPAEAEDAGLVAPEAGADGEPLTIIYTNYRGETSTRRIIPLGAPYWGSNEWHKEPQWLMRALDVDKGEERDFALKNMASATVLATLAADNEALRRAALHILPYLRFTVGPESRGHHPTMPSAVAAFQEAFGLSTEEACTEAARDYLSKHGGKADA